MIERIAKNIHKINLGEKVGRLACLSDIHWDNPKCDREKLKRHLDYCLENQIPVFVNGDFFCLMQGKGDKRHNKSEIRPEHNNARYLDSIVETAVDWFGPYKDVLLLIGYGNHETAIIKHQETDLLRRFADLFNYKWNASLQIGGYGGWIILEMNKSSTARFTKRMKYFHGSGGGGVVTRGEINLTRALEMAEGMDIYTLGHIHENKATNVTRESCEYNKGNRKYVHLHKDIHLMVTGTYKEEFGMGSSGWHVERNAPVKPIGGRILTMTHNRYIVDGTEFNDILIDSTKFPI